MFSVRRNGDEAEAQEHSSLHRQQLGEFHSQDELVNCKKQVSCRWLRLVRRRAAAGVTRVVIQGRVSREAREEEGEEDWGRGLKRGLS